MPIRLQVNHHCFNMMLCRWPPCCSIASCTRYGKDVTTCSIAVGSGIRCFKSSVLARGVSCTLFFVRPKGISVVLQDEASGHATWCLWCKKWICLGTVSWELASNLCCVSSCSKQYCVHDDSLAQYCTLSEQAGFQILNSVGFSWHAWSLDCLIL